MAHVAMQSGEGRFRWLHARPGRLDALREVVEEQLGDDAWIRTRQEAIGEGWYGPVVTDVAAGRLGDLLLAAKGSVAFNDPNDTGPFVLVGRHGSLTEDEMLVPLLAGSARCRELTRRPLRRASCLKRPPPGTTTSSSRQ